MLILKKKLSTKLVLATHTSYWSGSAATALTMFREAEPLTAAMVSVRSFAVFAAFAAFRFAVAVFAGAVFFVAVAFRVVLIFVSFSVVRVMAAKLDEIALGSEKAKSCGLEPFAMIYAFSTSSTSPLPPSPPFLVESPVYGKSNLGPKMIEEPE